MLDTCQACAREGELMAVLSVLDYREHMICTTCVDHRAETFQAFGHAVCRTGWQAIPIEVRKSFTMHRGGGIYMPPVPWMKLMLHQQLVVASDVKPRIDPNDLEDAELEAKAKRILAKIKRAQQPSVFSSRTAHFLDRLGARRLKARWSPIASLFGGL